MANLEDIIPFVAVLTIAAVLIGTFFLISEELKEDLASDPTYVATTVYVAADQLNSTTNLTIKPGVQSWVCFNATGDGSADGGTGTDEDVSEIHLVVDSKFAETVSLLNSTSRHDGADVNCSINSTDFSTELYQNLNKTEGAVGEFTDWYDIMAVVFAAALIIGLIFTALVSRRV